MNALPHKTQLKLSFSLWKLSIDDIVNVILVNALRGDEDTHAVH